jgi:hypothetical protein
MSSYAYTSNRSFPETSVEISGSSLCATQPFVSGVVLRQRHAPRR